MLKDSHTPKREFWKQRQGIVLRSKSAGSSNSDQQWSGEFIWTYLHLRTVTVGKISKIITSNTVCQWPDSYGNCGSSIFKYRSSSSIPSYDRNESRPSHLLFVAMKNKNRTTSCYSLPLVAMENLYRIPCYNVCRNVILNRSSCIVPVMMENLHTTSCFVSVALEKGHDIVSVAVENFCILVITVYYQEDCFETLHKRFIIYIQNPLFA